MEKNIVSSTIEKEPIEMYGRWIQKMINKNIVTTDIILGKRNRKATGKNTGSLTRLYVRMLNSELVNIIRDRNM